MGSWGNSDFSCLVLKVTPPVEKCWLMFMPGKALILQTLKLCYRLGWGGVGVRK